MLDPAPTSVLVLRMLGVGDVLWTTPFLANLRRGLPGARISYVVRRGCAPVLANNPDVDELLVFESDRAGYQLGFLRDLRRRRFGLSIDLICTTGTAIQSRVARAPLRVGFDFHVRRRAYTMALDAHAANHGHSVEFHLFALEALGIPVTTRELVWRRTAEEDDEAAATWASLGLPSTGPVVAVIPTGAFASKKWPVEHWRRLVAAPELRSAHFLLVWGSDTELADARSIREAAPLRATLLPRASLRQLAALLARCTAAAGNDSGPLHIATAMRIPVLGLYGRTNVKSQGPWGDGHRTLQPPGQPGGRVRGEDFEPAPMAELRPETVAAALREMLEKR